MSALPAYDHGDGPLPAYDDGDTLPPTFKIDKAYTTPLVSVSDVKAHLVILGAFRALRESVILEPSPIDPDMRDDVKWTLFLIRAALRFEAWVEYVVRKQARIRGEILPGLLDYEIPPLDVCGCSSDLPYSYRTHKLTRMPRLSNVLPCISPKPLPGTSCETYLYMPSVLTTGCV